jgi:hypothetical protein
MLAMDGLTCPAAVLADPPSTKVDSFQSTVLHRLQLALGGEQKRGYGSRLDQRAVRARAIEARCVMLLKDAAQDGGCPAGLLYTGCVDKRDYSLTNPRLMPTAVCCCRRLLL